MSQPVIEPISEGMSKLPILEDSGTNGLRITLAIDDRDLRDHLVVTFAKSGPITCPEILDSDSTSKALYELEQYGQTVTEPSLIGIVGRDGEARRIFVTPCPKDNFRDFAVWVGLVTDTIVNLKAQKIALYPCPGALSDENSFELTAQLVRALIDARACVELCLLVGRYSYNSLLNMALDLKTELKSSDYHVQVYH